MKQLFLMSLFSILSSMLFGQKKGPNKDFFTTELNTFNMNYSTELNKVQKVNSLPVNSIESETLNQNYNNLELWEVERKLFRLYQKGKITNDELLKILNEANEETVQILCDLVSKENVNQLNANKYYIDEISKVLVSKGRNTDEILDFKKNQNYPDIDKEIEQIISNLSTNAETETNFGFLLSKYYNKNNELSSLNLLEKVINTLPLNSEIGTNYDEKSHIFFKLLNSDNKEISNKTENLIVLYLEKNKFAQTYYIYLVLKQMNGDSFKNYLKERFNQIDINNEKELKYFRERLLTHYSRIFGFSSFPYIENEIKKITKDLEYTEDNNLKFKEYSIEVKFRDYLDGLQSLVDNNKLNKDESILILNFLNNIKLNNIGSYYWRNYIEITQKLYPNATFSDYQNNFRTEQLNEIKEYWNRKIYLSKNIDDYLSKLDNIGINYHKISDQQKNDYIVDNLYDKREVIIWRLLEFIKLGYNYDAESGFYPPPYEEILPKYLEICSSEFPNYTFTIQEIKTEQNKVNIILYLHNESSIFKIETEDYGDWFDVKAINSLFNKVLEINNKKQRFVNIFTYDQTVLPFYCEPGQAELFSQEFGMKLEHKLNFD